MKVISKFQRTKNNLIGEMKDMIRHFEEWQ